MTLKRDMSWWGRARDNFVCAVSNWLFEHVATPWYRAMIDGAMQVGLQTIDEWKDEAQNDTE